MSDKTTPWSRFGYCNQGDGDQVHSAGSHDNCSDCTRYLRWQPWVPQIGVTFIATGALVRSLIDLTKGREGNGLVGIDVAGKWNHAAKDTLSIITDSDVAEEWGHYLIEAAQAARKDQEKL